MSLSATLLAYPTTLQRSLLCVCELALVAVSEGDVTQDWYEAFTAHMVEEHALGSLEDPELPMAETTHLVDMYREWLSSESEDSYQLMDALTAYDHEDVYARTMAHLQARARAHQARRPLTTCPAA